MTPTIPSLSQEDLVIAQETMREMRQFVHHASDAIPENNYWLYSVFTILAPAILKETRHAPALMPQSQAAGLAWNYVDGGCSVLGGLIQLTDHYHHRPIVNKIKGLVNCLSGVQSIALSAISFSVFGAPAFAAGSGIGFALSLDEVIRAKKRQRSFDYWVKDSLAELDRINAVIIPDLEKQIAALTAMKDKGDLSLWTLKRKQKHLADYLGKKKEIEDDLIHRLAFRNGASEPKYKAELERLEKLLTQDRPETKNFDDKTRAFLKTLPEKASLIDFPTAQKREKDIIQKDAKAFSDASKNTFIWGVAFVGMLCLCFPVPGAQIAGLAFVGLASALYLIKNANKVREGTAWVNSYLFKANDAKGPLAKEIGEADKDAQELPDQEDEPPPEASPAATDAAADAEAQEQSDQEIDLPRKNSGRQTPTTPTDDPNAPEDESEDESEGEGEGEGSQEREDKHPHPH
jgi:hypothetical protein